MTDTATAPVFFIRGEFTIFTAQALKEQLVDLITHSDGKEIEVDLADVTDIDSAGLQLMVMAKQEAIAQNRALHFVRHSAPVLDLIDLCGLVPFFGDTVRIPSQTRGSHEL